MFQSFIKGSLREDFKKKNGIFYDIGIKGGRGKATNHNWKLVFNYDIRSLGRGNKKQCHNWIFLILSNPPVKSLLETPCACQDLSSFP